MHALFVVKPEGAQIAIKLSCKLKLQCDYDSFFKREVALKKLEWQYKFNVNVLAIKSKTNMSCSHFLSVYSSSYIFPIGLSFYI